MKTLILYYSLSGKTRAWARAVKDADAVEVKETRRRNLFTAFLPGCPQAMHRDASAIQPVTVDFSGYERIVLAAPVWASFPAPAFNAMAKLPPKGARVRVVLLSSGGDSSKSKDGTVKMLEDMGLIVKGYEDIRTGK